MNLVKKIESEQLKSEITEFYPGDTVRVHQVIQESGKERVQIFEGVVIACSGKGVNATFTVRKVSYNIGVERCYPVHSPRVQKIEVKQRGHVRRAKLFYLRERTGKAAKIKEAAYTGETQTPAS